MKIEWSGLTFGGPEDDWYWIYWWNPLPSNIRYIGYVQDWYDGPISTFGLWWCNIGWSLPFTRHNGDKEFVYRSKTYRQLLKELKERK